MVKIHFYDLPDTTTPIDADNLNQVQDNVENEFTSKQTSIDNLSGEIGTLSNLNTTNKSNIVSAINEVNSKYKGTVLWKNNNHDQDFGMQTITLSSDDYDELIIFCIYSKTVSGGLLISQKVLKGYGTRIIGVSEGGFQYWSRTFNYNSDTSYSINNCMLMTSNGGSNANGSIIPILIVGYKTGLNV